jgi:hypothetical protein
MLNTNDVLFCSFKTSGINEKAVRIPVQRCIDSHWDELWICSFEASDSIDSSSTASAYIADRKIQLKFITEISQSVPSQHFKWTEHSIKYIVLFSYFNI